MKQNRYVICPSCHAMSPSFETMCDQCGAPLINPAVVGTSQPTEPVRQTPFQPPSTIRLIGVWAISLPNVVGGAYFVFWVLKNLSGLTEFIMFWGAVGLTCLWFTIWYRVTKHYFFRNRQASD